MKHNYGSVSFNYRGGICLQDVGQLTVIQIIMNTRVS